MQKGFAYVESKQAANEPNISCPFCKQSIDSKSDILNAFASKFNADFNTLIQRLQIHLLSLQNFNLEATILAFNNIKQTQIELLLGQHIYPIQFKRQFLTSLSTK